MFLSLVVLELGDLILTSIVFLHTFKSPVIHWPVSLHYEKLTKHAILFHSMQYPLQTKSTLMCWEIEAPASLQISGALCRLDYGWLLWLL